MEKYSHIVRSEREGEGWLCQSTDEHNTGVARLASEYAATFGFGDLGMIMGRLHDKGKEQVEW